MKFAFYTNCISPHQLPLADEIIKLLGAENYSYIYTELLSNERRKLGWNDALIADWCRQGDDSSVELQSADILLSEHRSIKLFERRATNGKITIYCSERWFKPVVGILRLLSFSYFRMAFRFVRLLSSDSNFYYYPMGIHAARDMARLCGLLHGDWRCLFKAPEIDFERRPGGCIWLRNKSTTTNKYCLDKMRMWGYFVNSSKLRVKSLVVEETLGDRGNGQNESSAQAPNKISVLWVGRLLKLKRVDTIIHAVGECKKRRLVDVSLPMVTLDIYGVGPEEMRLKKMAIRYGEVIKFHPPVSIEEVRKLMSKHDLYVLSSNAHEGWGAVISEALEEGMKVVGTYEAGASATILPKSLLFKASDYKKLSSLLLGDIDVLGIGAWTASSAAKHIVNVFYKRD